MYSGGFLTFVLLEHVPSLELHSCPPTGVEVEATDESAAVGTTDEGADMRTTDEGATSVGVVGVVA